MIKKKIPWEEHIAMFYTKKGSEGLVNRLQNFVGLLINTPKTDYPLKFYMFDYPQVIIQHPIELRNRIKELMDILNITSFEHSVNGKDMIPINKESLDNYGGN